MYEPTLNRPRTYAEVRQGRAENTHNGITKVACECGRWVHFYVLVDVRDLPIEVTRGQEWACDGCWKKWMRPDPAHQRTLNGQPFTELDWLEQHGAPPSAIARQEARDRDRLTELRAMLGQAKGREVERIDGLINRSVKARLRA